MSVHRTARRTARRATAAATAVLAVGALTAAPALAAAVARVTAPVAVTSASWGAQAGAVGAAPGAGSYVVQFGTLGTITPRYFSVTNTGNRALTGQTYTAVNSKPTTGNAPPAVALDACVGATWSTTLNTCGGTVVRLTSSDLGATTTTVALPVGGVLSVRAAPFTLVNFPNPYNTTVTVAVSRAQAGAVATTRS